MDIEMSQQLNQQQEWPDMDHPQVGPGTPGEGGTLVVPPLDSETTMDRPSMDGPGMSGGSEIEIEI
jgi:hypothetical protein